MVNFWGCKITTFFHTNYMLLQFFMGGLPKAGFSKHDAAFTTKWIRSFFQKMKGRKRREATIVRQKCIKCFLFIVKSFIINKIQFF